MRPPLRNLGTITSTVLLCLTLTLWTASNSKQFEFSFATHSRYYTITSEFGWISLGWECRPENAATPTTFRHTNLPTTHFPVTSENFPRPGTFHSEYIPSRGLIIPFWLLLLPLLPLPARAAYLRHRARTRAGSRLCPTCGYDLRATPGRCPECGAPTGAPAPTK